MDLWLPINNLRQINRNKVFVFCSFYLISNTRNIFFTGLTLQTMLVIMLGFLMKKQSILHIQKHLIVDVVLIGLRLNNHIKKNWSKILKSLFVLLSLYFRFSVMFFFYVVRIILFILHAHNKYDRWNDITYRYKYIQMIIVYLFSKKSIDYR